MAYRDRAGMAAIYCCIMRTFHFQGTKLTLSIRKFQGGKEYKKFLDGNPLTRKEAMFTAGDQKLLAALASQAGIAIANAREVEARERRLKQQIKALRIKIDETKKQREVNAVTEKEWFAHLQENARQMRAEFDI